MADFEYVPVVDVHQDNFRDIWPTIIHSVKTATFISLDTELSGLGDRKKLSASSVDDRYKGATETAKTRSLVSLGISCFTRLSPTTANGCHGDRYRVNTFNLILLCQQDYLVEPASLKFLVNHGFDFNKQYSKGIPYDRGTDKDGRSSYQSVRQLFVEILSSGRPLVFHNAFVDLIFLYENLYATLPSAMSTFLADLTEMFVGGILDTKYVTDFHYRIPASYLEYVFRKSQRDNAKKWSRDESAVHLQFPAYPKDHNHVHYSNCRLPENLRTSPGNETTEEKLTEIVCANYSAHGWCKKTVYCPKSHDIDLILDLDSLVSSKKTRKRRRRNRKGATPDDMESDIPVTNVVNSNSAQNGQDRPSIEKTDEFPVSGDDLVSSLSNLSSPSSKRQHSSEESDMDMANVENGVKSEEDSTSKNSRCVGHRAGIDAFMTGFIMATYFSRHCGEQGKDFCFQDSVQEFQNKIYLTGKDIPLIISKSSFAKTSKDHREKFSKLQKPMENC